MTEPERRLRCPRCLGDARITVHQQIACLNKEVCGSVWTAAEAALVGLDQFRPEDPERQAAGEPS